MVSGGAPTPLRPNLLRRMRADMSEASSLQHTPGALAFFSKRRVSKMLHVDL